MLFRSGDSCLLELPSSETMRLFFAGEHTTALFPSMAHGAMRKCLFLAELSVRLEIESHFCCFFLVSLGSTGCKGNLRIHDRAYE